MGVSGCSRESRSVPKPASPMMSSVVRFSHSKTSKDLTLTFSRVMAFSHKLESKSALRWKTGASARMDWIEKPGVSAFLCRT